MELDRLTARRIVAIAAVVGLALRVAFGLLYWVDKPMTHDEHEYLALAAALAEGRGFTYTEPAAGTTAQFGRAPGYPAFLALIGAGTTSATGAPTRVKIAQAILGALTVCLVAVAAWRAAGPGAGIVAASLAAVYPPLVWISSYVFSESLYALLAIATALTLQAAVDLETRGPSSAAGRLRTAGDQLRRDRAEARLTRAREGGGARDSGARGFAAGVLCGAAILVRPAMLFFLPLAMIWLLWRRAPRLAIAFVVGAILVVAPWTVRNYATHGRFILVASEGGVTFWTGNHPLSRGEGDLAANPALKLAELEFRRAHPALTSEELEPLYYREAIGYITSHPAWWVGLLARKAFYTVVPAGPSYALHSVRYRTASVLSYVLLLPFGIAGAVLLWPRPSRPTALLLLAASAALVCLVFFPQERFRIPVIDPVLIVCAASLRRGAQPPIASL